VRVTYNTKKYFDIRLELKKTRLYVGFFAKIMENTQTVHVGLITMSVHTLPDVLIQLIMQHLHVKERLRWARCSTVMRRVASNLFAWRHCIPIHVANRTLPFVSNQSPFTPYIPTHVQLYKYLPPLLQPSTLRVVALGVENEGHNTLASADKMPFKMTHLRYLHLKHVDGYDLKEWCEVATNVRVMHLDCTLLRGSDFAPIASLPHLDTLSLYELENGHEDYMFPAIGACSSLRRLDLNKCPFYFDSFDVLCDTPSFARLHELWMHNCRAFYTREAEHTVNISEGFAKLQSLHTFSYEPLGPWDMQTILKCIHRVPHLTHLRMNWSIRVGMESDLESIMFIGLFMQHVPNVHVTIHVGRKAPIPPVLSTLESQQLARLQWGNYPMSAWIYTESNNPV
jgi:hypothetical protein